MHLTQNLFDKNKYARTISLNAHYIVLFKNPRNVTQFATLARQMYPNSSKFAIEAYRDATSVPFEYLLVDLKPDQDERRRLRTNIFPGVRVRKEIKGGASDGTSSLRIKHEVVLRQV